MGAFFASQRRDWWTAYRAGMTDMPPPPQRTCIQCGQPTLKVQERQLTTKKRSKFGLGWLIVCLFSVGLGLIVYLMWPRHTEVIGVDRWVECTSCGTKQP